MSTELTLADITALRIDGLEQQNFVLKGSNKNTLSDTNFISIFIGENNAGKSRLLRTILDASIKNIDVGSNLKDQLKQTINDNMSPVGRLNHQVTNSANYLNNALNTATYTPLDSELHNWVNDTVNQFSLNATRQSDSAKNEATIRLALGQPLVNQVSDLAIACTPVLKLLKNREYIPILRGLRPLDPLRDLCKERTYNDYFDIGNDKNSEFSIFTGYSLYSDIMHSLLGTEEERENVKRFEAYLSKYFFEGKSVTLIPKKDREGAEKPNDVVYVKIDEEPMRPIYKLGDGIQAIITLTVRPFLVQVPTMFFIEEPEQHLHAGMQRALIQAFRYRSIHKYFFTTQSNHFIDLSIESDDISLFSVKKVLGDKGNSKAEVSNQKDRSDILKDLGVLASSVLLANCSVWVEGITDKLYLRVYLQRFIKDLKAKSESPDHSLSEQQGFFQRHKKLSSFNENLHYVFVEYQGSNITHWNFSDSIKDSTDTPARMLSKDIFLLADQDIDTKGTRVTELKEAMGDNFCLLEWKEIENYIPQNVINKTANERWTTFIGKAESSFDPSSISANAFELKDAGIGEELEKFVKRSNSVKPDRKFFEDKSGTIKDKVKFCEAACNFMKTKDKEWGLTPELEKLCDQIWTFIEKNNDI